MVAVDADAVVEIVSWGRVGVGEGGSSRADREGVIHGLGAQGGEPAEVAAIMADHLAALDAGE